MYLAEAFTNSTRNDTTMVFTGYTNVNADDAKPNNTDKIRSLFLEVFIRFNTLKF